MGVRPRTRTRGERPQGRPTISNSHGGRKPNYPRGKALAHLPGPGDPRTEESSCPRVQLVRKALFKNTGTLTIIIMSYPSRQPTPPSLLHLIPASQLPADHLDPCYRKFDANRP